VGIHLVDKPTYDPNAAQQNYLRHLDRGIRCAGVTAVAHGGVIDINVTLDPPDAKGVWLEIKLAGKERPVSGFAEGTDVTVDPGHPITGYGRAVVTAGVPISDKLVNHLGCAPVGIAGA
jgi:hypothetical protein